MRQSKRIEFIKSQMPSGGRLGLREAVNHLKGVESLLPDGIRRCRFDQSVSVSVRLGIDPRQADQIVRGAITMPHGIGKSRKVLVFAQGEAVNAAIEAGADYAGGKDLADKIRGGWVDFDVAVTTPDMMGVVGPLGKILGPRGLMPSPKAGTVTSDVRSVIREFKLGRVEFRCDSSGIVHCVTGRLSFSAEMLVENTDALLRYLKSLKPSSSRGQYFRTISIAATMTPGMFIEY